MIEVYKSNNKDFEMNGDITLDPISAIFKIELNGICEVEIEHHYDSIGRWKYLKEDSVVSGPTPWSSKQLFRIYDTEKTLTGIKAYARHIYFDLVKTNIISNLHIKSKNGQEALEKLLERTPYIAHSNIVTINDCYFFKNNVIQGISGNQDNTFLKRWGGEIFFDNFDIYINSRIGGDHGAKISYAYNMEDLSLKRNIEGVFTRIYPYVVKNTTDTIELPEDYIDSPNINKYDEIYEKYINLSEYMHLKDGEDDVENAYETEEELYEAMRNKCKELFEKGLDKPKVTGSVNMILLENTIEYEHVKDLVKVNLGDDIVVEHLDIGVETITRCVGYTWDMINKKYIDINLGEIENDYFDIQSSTTNNLNNVLNDNGTLNSAKMQGIIDGLKTQFTVMRDVAQPQQVLAMLFEDKIKGSATYGALALGTMGIMIARERTPDDRDWDWRTFIGGGYAYADQLIGNLRTVLIESMDRSFSMNLNESGGMIFKNNDKEAIRIKNNAIDLYNWGKTGELIGSLTALLRGKDPNKPLIGIVNERNSAVSIGYKKANSDTIYPSYIEFDKYNILNNYKPIRIYENVSLGGCSLFFGANDTGEIFSTSEGDIVLKTKHAFGTVDKDSGHWTSFLGADNIFFAHWKTGREYFSASSDAFTLPGIFKAKGNDAVWVDRDLSVDRNFHTNGDITCSGRKNRVVNTEHYGTRLQNAIESPECWFIDYGEGTLVNNKAVIKIDPIHLETINTDYPYKIRVWSDDGTKVWCRKAKRYKKYFVVEGEQDCEFEYELIAKQKDYEEARLEEVAKDNEYYLNKRTNQNKGGVKSGTIEKSNNRDK